jgi:hypothetical protein
MFQVDDLEDGVKKKKKLWDNTALYCPRVFLIRKEGIILCANLNKCMCTVYSSKNIQDILI